MSEKCYQCGEDLLKFSQDIKRMRLKTKNKKELLQLFAYFRKKYETLCSFLYYTQSAVDFLEKTIREELEKILALQGKDELLEEYLSLLTAPIKQNLVNKQQDELLWMAMKLQQKHDISNDLNKYMENYLWLSARDGVSEPDSRKSIIERITELSTQNPQQKLAEIVKERKLTQQRYREVVQELSLSGTLLHLIQTAKEFVYLRTYRTDILASAFFNIRPLLREIGSKINLEFEEVCYLTADEVEKLKSKTPSKKKIAERIQDYAFLVLKSKKKVVVGKELNRLKEKSNSNNNSKSKVSTEIKGKPAYDGIVQGTVKIVLTAKDMYKIKEGDVLVASMTTPDIVPAMQKAAAFITDEGGMTCHAAIIAREMKKPCVVGTRNATKVLKDGDRVEIDAGKGTVRKI
ncbi:hypothetical protein J4444_02495 [Candidatus Woesearchaeota archaeon]|nr:hypothetical protein [Candidatus Woesearchaeota archaeon]